MNQFTTLLIKEWRDYWRSFKWIWVPLVFVLLGIMDPIVNYFMDDIMASVGNMPDGFQMILPDYTAIDIYTASTSEFQSIGIIVLVAIFANVISRERQQGTATLIYIRPISYTSYFLSKWVMANALAVTSIVLGYFGSFYYTTLLYEKVDLGKFLAMVGTYCVWIIFAVTFALAMSAAFKTSISMAISIVVIPVFLIIDSLIGGFWTLVPWKIGNYGIQILAGSVDWQDYYVTLTITIALIVLFFVIGIFMSKKNAGTAKI